MTGPQPGPHTGPDPAGTVATVWRMEGGRVLAAVAAMTGDLAAAEDLCQEALADALAQWSDGAPRNPAAWLTTVAKRRAIDGWRRADRLDRRYEAIAHELRAAPSDSGPEAEVVEADPIDDDLLRLIFTACHPVLGREAQLALTLRTVGGLATEEIARLFLVPTPTMAARITRAKKTLTAAKVPFATPDPDQWGGRLGAVLRVIYLIFSEGYAPTAGPDPVRPDVAAEALRLGRVLAALLPAEPEVHALVALMELQASRFPVRVGADGAAVPLEDQDRTRWDRARITRGRTALARADALGRGRGNYALQAAIAQCHAVAPSVPETDFDAIVVLYEALERLTGNPVVALNRAVAVSMTAAGPRAALEIVDGVADDRRLTGSPLVPAVRGELLARLGEIDGARAALTAAAEATRNEARRTALLARLRALPTR